MPDLGAFELHIDCPTWALVGADAAALAVVQIYFIFAAFDFNHGIIRADAKAVIATKAVAAGETASRFKYRSFGI